MRLRAELETLLGRVCVEWGFCLPSNEYAEIAQSSEMDATTFALSILRAEGFEPPEHEVEWQRRLRNLFIEHFGVSAVKSSDF